MKYYRISLTITAFSSTDHPRFHCFLFCDTNGQYESRTIDIHTANKLMWQLKQKGWETKTTASYNPYTPGVYTRNICWLHLE